MVEAATGPKRPLRDRGGRLNIAKNIYHTCIRRLRMGTLSEFREDVIAATRMTRRPHVEESMMISR